MQNRLTLIGLLLSGIFLWLALRNVEIGSFVKVLASAQWWLILPFLVTFAVFYWLKAIRWKVLLQPDSDLSAAALASPMMIGFAANNIFPFRAGEVIRVLVASDALGISKARILATVVVERVFDLLSVAILVIGGLAFQMLYLNSGLDARSVLVAAILMACGGVAVLFILPWFAKKYFICLTRFIPHRFNAQAVALIEKFNLGLTALSSSRSVLIIAINSLLQWSLMAFCIYLACIALKLEVASFAIATTIMGIVILGISMPSTAGFLGTIQYAFVLGLGVYGIDPENALATSVYYHVLSFSFTTGTGAIYYIIYKFGSPRKSGRRKIDKSHLL